MIVAIAHPFFVRDDCDDDAPDIVCGSDKPVELWRLGDSGHCQQCGEVLELDDCYMCKENENTGKFLCFFCWCHGYGNSDY